MNKRINPDEVKWMVWITYALITATGLLHHEMWRDEYVEFLQARDTRGLFSLGNTMSQGHAMLWQTSLWFLIQFTRKPEIMQLFHGIIAISSAYLLIFRSPFKVWQSAVMLGGYFLLFEYAIVSRCYAFAVLFLFLFAGLYKRKSLRAGAALCLFFLANTSVYGMMLAGVLLLWVAWEEVVPHEGKWVVPAPQSLVYLLLAMSGVVLAYLQIHPQSDNTYPLHLTTWPFSMYRFKVAIAQVFHAFVPVPDFTGDHLWNTNYFMSSDRLNLWYLALPVLIGVSLPFYRNGRIMGLWLSGTLLIVFFQYLTGFRFARYYGHIFIWWIFCIWLHISKQTGEQSGNRLFYAVWFVVTLAQLAGGLIMYHADYIGKFSRGKDAAKFLKRKNLEDAHLIGSVDFALSPFSAELNTRVFTMQHMSMQSYTKWDRLRRNSMDSVLLMEALNSAPAGKDIVFIASHPIPQFEYFRARAERRKIPVAFDFGPFRFRRLAYFRPGIEHLEGYWLFKVQKNNINPHTFLIN